MIANPLSCFSLDQGYLYFYLLPLMSRVFFHVEDDDAG